MATKQSLAYYVVREQERLPRRSLGSRLAMTIFSVIARSSGSMYGDEAI